MKDVRCACDKLVSKIEEDKIIIKCRHCKRFVVIQARQITRVEYKNYRQSSETRVQRL